MANYPCPRCRGNGWRWIDGERETCRVCGGEGMVDYDELCERRKRRAKVAKAKRQKRQKRQKRAKPR